MAHQNSALTIYKMFDWSKLQVFADNELNFAEMGDIFSSKVWKTLW